MSGQSQIAVNRSQTAGATCLHHPAALVRLLLPPRGAAALAADTAAALRLTKHKTAALGLTLSRGADQYPVRPDPVFTTAELPFRVTQNARTELNSG